MRKHAFRARWVRRIIRHTIADPHHARAYYHRKALRPRLSQTGHERRPRLQHDAARPCDDRSGMNDRHRATRCARLLLVDARDRSAVGRRTTPASIVPRNSADAIALLLSMHSCYITGSAPASRQVGVECVKQPPYTTSGSGSKRLLGSPQAGEAIGLTVVRADRRPVFPVGGARIDASTPFPDDGACADGFLRVCDRIRSARMDPLDVVRSSRQTLEGG